MTTPTPIYLDYAATTPVDPRVVTAMIHCLTQEGLFANASSAHSFGQAAQAMILQAQQQVANLLNTDAKSVIWTSGATEANNLALKGVAFEYQTRGRHIITSQTEHKASIETCEFLQKCGFEVSYLAVTPTGLIELETLKKAIRADTILISLHHVNNETGTIQDLSAISRFARSQGIFLHVDASQSVGKLKIDLRETPIDLLSCSAHKLYGPKGIGALIVQRYPRVHLQKQMHGGQQQAGLRSGTLATHQIVGMGKAYEIAAQEMDAEQKRISDLSHQLLQQLQYIWAIKLNGDSKQRLANILNVSFMNIDGVKLQTLLEKQLAVASGAACNTLNIEPSYVLTAMGCSREQAVSAIRFSLGRYTTENDINQACQILKTALANAKK